jgi:hypothetical protein
MSMDNIPFIDTHCHVLPVAMETKPLSALLLNYAVLPTFLSAGMPEKLANGIAASSLPKEEAKRAMLTYLPIIAQTSAAEAVCRGILVWTTVQGTQITAENYDAIERALHEKPQNAWRASFRQANLRKALINVNSAEGAALFTGKTLLPADFNEYFALIPTFDAHALHPEEPHIQGVAKHLGLSLETLADYLAFIEVYLDGFMQKFPVAGLKISEQYFRRLDYAPQLRENAEKLYARGANREKALLDFITMHVFALAELRGLTVQFHTGMLWREPGTESLHPTDLCESIRRFPKLRFDLLHLGFPYLGAAAAMALNARNVSLNLSWLPLISEDLTADWLVRLLEMLPANKLSFGTDVFDVPTMLGTMELIRTIVARAAKRFPNEESIASRLLYQNAEELYRV